MSGCHASPRSPGSALNASQRIGTGLRSLSGRRREGSMDGAGGNPSPGCFNILFGIWAALVYAIHVVMTTGLPAIATTLVCFAIFVGLMFLFAKTRPRNDGKDS